MRGLRGLNDEEFRDEFLASMRETRLTPEMFEQVASRTKTAAEQLREMTEAIMAVREAVRTFAPGHLRRTAIRFEVFSAVEFRHALGMHLRGPEYPLREESVRACSSPAMRWERMGYVNPFHTIPVVEKLEVPAGTVRVIGTEGEVLGHVPMWRRKR